ncbi:MAG: tRNA (uridine(34)/cytosine(34)/5-carboxymethylaminomethyluridine(34)-2'-O)-methyltransferase TrmL [Proteobacteria bacterium]|nr:MAG: tRNA (uridine(34)/cytosine(34)/5-carboxymethylaminomethyluridine(34)-2'-O)-methyltransferase TrmL [Pseudomonadota bacterium]
MHVVLVNPEIPQNTGSIARTCAATRTSLHLVGKVAFDISERAVRRAGLDYWPHVQLSTHKDWEGFTAAINPPRVWLFSKFGERLHYQAEFNEEDALVFGSETKGLGQEFLARFPKEQILRIPIVCAEVRSLNLSNAVSIAVYEARRQLKLDEERCEGATGESKETIR